MQTQFYKLGARTLRQRLGLQEPEKDHTVRNVAMGAAAASPFMGLIGQKPITKDPHINPSIRRTTLREISELARPGDVVVSSEPHWSGWKLFQTPVTGTEFYHAFPVVGQRQGRGTDVTAGELYDPKRKKPLTTTGAKRQLEELQSDMRRQKYRDVMLMRPDQPLNPDQVKAFQEETLRRAQTKYAPSRGVRAFLRDIFVPKVKGLENISPTCEGNVCSTLPSQAHKTVTGTNLVPGKPAKSILTADYLREGSKLKPIAAHIRSTPRFSPRAMRTLGLGLRGGLGLGLAGGTYAVSEDPALAAVPLGLALTPTLGRRVAARLAERRAQRAAETAGEKITPALLTTARKRGYNVFRPLGHAINYIGDMSQTARLKLKGIGKRTIPLALAGGLASYLAGKGVNAAFD